MNEILSIFSQENQQRKINEKLREESVRAGFLVGEPRKKYINDLVELILHFPTDEIYTNNDAKDKIFALLVSCNPGTEKYIKLQNLESPVFFKSHFFDAIKNLPHTDEMKESLKQILTNLTISEFNSNMDFYCQDQYFPVKYLPSAIDSELSSSYLEIPLASFFSNLGKITPDNVTSSFAEFYGRILRHISFTNNLNIDSALFKEIFNSFTPVFRAFSNFPSSIVNNVIHPWLFIAHNAYIYARTKFDEALYQQINLHFDFFARILYNIALWKYDELDPGYSNYITFILYDMIDVPQTRQMLDVFIVQRVRKIKSSHELQLMEKVLDQFQKKLEYELSNTIYASSFYLTSLCNDALDQILFNIEDIKGVRIVGNDQKEMIYKRKISFNEQTSEDKKFSIDDEIKTIIEEKGFHNYEDAVKFFDMELKKFNDSMQELISLTEVSYRVLMAITRTCMSVSQEIIENTLTLIQKTHEKISDLFIATHYKAQTLTSSAKRLNIKREVVSFSEVFEKFYRTSLILPNEYHDFVAKRISEILIKSCVEGTVTFGVAKFILEKQENNFGTFYSNVAKHYISIFNSLNYMQKELSRTYAKGYVRALLCFMRIIIISKMSESALAVLLQTNKLLLTSSMYLCLKKTPNQKIVCRGLKFVFDAMEIINKSSFFALKFQILNDLPPQAQIELIPCISKLANSDKEGNFDIISVIDQIKHALKSDNVSYMETATNIFLKAIMKDQDIKTNCTDQRVLEVFKLITQKMSLFSQKTQKTIAKSLPELANLYIPINFYEDKNIMKINGVEIDFDTLFADICLSLDDTEHIAYDKLYLISSLFENVFEQLSQGIDVNREIIKYLTNELILLLVNDHLKAEVDKVLGRITNTFIEIYKETKNTTFFFILCEIGANTSSSIGKEAVRIGKEFIRAIIQSAEKIEAIKEIITNMFNYYSSGTINSSLLIGISVFSYFCPMAFDNNMIIQFIKISDNSLPRDTERPEILTKAFDKLVCVIPEENKADFIKKCYDLLGQKLLSTRIVIINAMKEVKVPIDVNSLDDVIDIKGNMETTCQQLCACLQCGITGTVDTGPKLMEFVEKFFSAKEEKQKIDFAYRKAYLFYCFAANNDTIKIFQDVNDCTKTLASFLCTILTTKFKPLKKLAKDAVAIIGKKTDKKSIFADQINDYLANPGAIFQFMSSQPERIIFFKRIASIFPERITPPVFASFISAFFNYSKLDDENLMKYIPNAANILKFLCIKAFSNSSTFIIPSMMDNFIEAVYNLYSHKEIQFRQMFCDRVSLFLKLYMDHSVAILLFSKRPDRPMYSVILADAILADKTGSIFFMTMRQIIVYANSLNSRVISFLRTIAKQKHILVHTDFCNCIKYLFNTLLTINMDGINQYLNNNLEIFNSIAEIYFDILVEKKNIEDILDFTKLFEIENMTASSHFNKFIDTFMKNGSPEIVAAITKKLVFNNIFTKSNSAIYEYAIKYGNPTEAEVFQMLKIVIYDNSAFKAQRMASLYQLLKKYGFPVKLSKVVIDNLVDCIRDQSTPITVTGLKGFDYCLRKDVVGVDISKPVIKLFFTDKRYIEVPLLKYTKRIIAHFNDHIDEIEDVVAGPLNDLVLGGFVSIEESRRVIEFISAAPRLVELLPIDPVMAIVRGISRLDDNISNQRVKTLLFFDKILELSPKLTNDKDVLWTVAELTIQLINVMVDKFKAIDPQFEKERNEYMPSLVVKKLAAFIIDNSLKVPIKIINKMGKETINETSFSIICASCQALDPETLYESFSTYESALQYGFEYSKSINEDLFVFMLNKLLLFPDYSARFKYVIYFLQEKILDTFCESTLRCPLTLEVFLKACNDVEAIEYLTQTWSVVDAKDDEDDEILAVIYKFLFKGIIYVAQSRQGEYAALLMKEASSDALICDSFLKTLPLIIESKDVSSEVKKEFITYMTETDQPVDVDSLNKIIDYFLDMPHLQQIQFVPEIFSVSCLLSEKVHNKKMTAIIGCLENFLPKSKEERLMFIITKCPISLWRNQRLAFTVLTCMRNETTTFKMLQLFSKNCAEAATSFATELFKSTMTTENISTIIDFLIKLTKQENMMNVTEAILYAFYKLNMPLNEKVLIRSIRSSGSYELFNLMQYDSPLKAKYIIEDEMDEVEFAKNYDSLEPYQASGIALTLLNKYEAASIVYDAHKEETTCPVFNEMMKLNDHFLSHDDEKKSSLITPLLPIDQKDNELISKLKSYFTEYVENEAISSNFDIVIAKLASPISWSQHDKRMLIAHAITYQLLDSGNQAKDFPIIRDRNFISSINTKVLSVIQDIKKLHNKTPESKYPPIDEEQEAVMVLAKNFRYQFSSICGITSRGQIAVSAKQLEEYIEKFSSSVKEKDPSDQSIRKFCLVAFNLFLIQPEKGLLKALLNTYSKSINLCTNEASLQTQEAISKIITLIKFIVKEKKFFDNYVSHSISKAFENKSVWKSWIQEILKIPEDILKAKELIQAYPSIAYNIAIEKGDQDIADYVLKKVDLQDGRTIKYLCDAPESIFKFDLLLVSRQEKAEAFGKALLEYLDEGKELKDNEQIMVIPKLKELFMALNEDDKTRFNLVDIAKKLLRRKDRLSFIITTLTEERNILPQFHEKLVEVVSELNILLPVNNQILQRSIIMFKGKYEYLGNDLFNIPVITELSNDNLVITSSNKMNHAISASFINNVNLLIRNNFTAKSRNLFVPSMRFYQISKMICGCLVNNDIFTLSSLYLKHVNRDPEEIEKGREIRDDLLLNRFMEGRDAKNFILARNNALRTYATVSTIREIFNTSYPSIGRVLFIGTNAALVPDYLFIEKESESEPSIRLSPNIVKLLGHNFKGRMIIKIGAAANAFIQQIESARSMCESVIVSCLNNDKILSLDDILTERNEIEARFEELAPPTSTSNTEEDCTDWISKIDAIVSEAMKIEGKPESAIPWF